MGFTEPLRVKLLHLLARAIESVKGCWSNIGLLLFYVYVYTSHTALDADCPGSGGNNREVRFTRFSDQPKLDLEEEFL